MAVRTKPLAEYAFPMNTSSLASAADLDFASKTLYIPEATSRQFLSVILQVGARSHSAAGTNLTARKLGIKLGAAAFDEQTRTATIGPGGEHNGWIFERDVTAYFNTNFGAGASQTCQVRVAFTGPLTINHWAKLLIWYQAEDGTTRLKTARIPIEGLTAGFLTATLAELGTNQIPILTGGSGILKEASPVVRDWFIEVDGNEVAGNATTAYGLGMQIDSDTEYTAGQHDNTLASSCAFRNIYSRVGSVPTTTSVHAFKARCNNLTDHYQIAPHLVVTYEYDHASTTRCLQSLLVPMAPVGESGNNLSGITSGNLERYRAVVMIEEPGTITLEQSGVVVYVGGGNLNADQTFSIGVGAQAKRTYNIEQTSVLWGGQTALMHRIDAGGAQGAALTLQRGLNVIDLEMYSSNDQMSAPCPILMLNYSSDKATAGDGVHNRNGQFLVRDHDYAPATAIETASVAPAIVESEYYLTGVGPISAANLDQDGTADVPWLAALGASEGKGAGFTSFAGRGMQGENETGFWIVSYNAARLFKRWPADWDPERMDLELARKYRLVDVSAGTVALSLLFVIHNITKAIAGTVSGFTGDGSGITVTAHRKDTGEKIGSAVTGSGGTFSITWYDDTGDVFAQARQDASHLGRSDDGTPGADTFDIALQAPASGGSPAAPAGYTRLASGPLISFGARGRASLSTGTADTNYPLANAFDGDPATPFRAAAAGTIAIDIDLDLMKGAGDFETWGGGSPAGFTEANAGTGDAVQTSVGGEVATGSSAAKLTAGTGKAELQILLDVRAGEKGRFSCRLRGDGSGSARARVQDQATGKWLTSAGLWQTTPVDFAAVSAAAYSTFAVNTTIESPIPWRPRYAKRQIKVFFFNNNTTTNAFVDAAYWHPAVELVAFFGHQIPPSAVLDIKSADDAAFTVNVVTEAAGVQVLDPTFYVQLAAAVYKRYWRILVTDTAAIEKLVINEILLTQPFTLAIPPRHPQVSPWQVNEQQPQERTDTPGGKTWAYNRSDAPRRKATLPFRHGYAAAFEELRNQAYQRSEYGQCPLVLIPWSNDTTILWGKVGAAWSYQRAAGGGDVDAVFDSALELVEEGFGDRLG